MTESVLSATMRRILVVLTAVTTAAFMLLIVVAVWVFQGFGTVTNQQRILDGQACNAAIVNEIIVAAIRDDPARLMVLAERLEAQDCE